MQKNTPTKDKSTQSTLYSFFKPIPKNNVQSGNVNGNKVQDGDTNGSNKEEDGNVKAIQKKFEFNYNDIKNNNVNNNVNINNDHNSDTNQIDRPTETRRSRRRTRPTNYYVSEDEDEMGNKDDEYKDEQPNKYSKNFIESDSEEDSEILKKLNELEKSNNKVTSIKIEEDSEEDEEFSNKLKQFGTSKNNVKLFSPISSKREASNLSTPINNLQQFASQKVTKEVGFTPTKSKKKDNGEERYEWLANILDKNKNPPDHPDYDKRSLYIPPSAWHKFTPFEKQFWEIKSNHFDTVVFFKKGKFFELYENDALIGHQKFDLKMTDRVNMRMVGVPESSFEFWAGKFIAVGYKVAKVEQMESSIGKTLREREKGKQDKVIKRELTSILTKGTLIDPKMINDDMNNYCLSIQQDNLNFGISLVDASMAEFRIGSFTDDEELTKLETLILQILPKEIVYEKNKLSNKVLKLINNYLNDVILNPLSCAEFGDYDTTLYQIKETNYFNTDDINQWPQALQNAMNHKIAISSFGGLIYYLKSIKLDYQLLSLKNIKSLEGQLIKDTLLLDGQTLFNLQILQNSVDNTKKGTLIEIVNHCVTPAGKRLIKTWLCHPLRDIEQINCRLDAIEDIEKHGFIQDLVNQFVGLPDLERILSRIHAGSIKINELLNVVKAFKEIQIIINELKPILTKCKSQLLKDLVSNFPDLTDKLAYFETGFDHGLALKEGTIVPYPGVEKEYDAIQKRKSELEDKFKIYLEEQKEELNCKNMAYKDINKEIYQLEVPANLRVPNNWIKISQTKQVRRYRTPITNKMVQKMEEIKEIRMSILNQIQKETFIKFDKNYNTFINAVRVVANIDALISLFKASKLIGEPSVRPKFIDPTTTNKACLDFKDARHPCLSDSIQYISNDTQLGHNNGKVVLLTGPNMGGKSTLLRQLCIIIIMAQMGCYVPASYCELTPFDRVFTRIGANDNILAGQSTFMVELAETSKILREATPFSMVILDELGRGTSTFDGYSIAYSVLYYLIHKIGCLTFFSTHYHMLTNDFLNYSNVRMMHMDCLTDPNSNKVTFLYKLKDGVCNKSYGMNVASMAGIPDQVIQIAQDKADEFENQHSILNSNPNDLPLHLIADLVNLIDKLNHKDNFEGCIDAWDKYLE